MSSMEDSTPSFDVDAINVKPLWQQMAKLNPPLPNPQTIPHVWDYSQIRPYLLVAGETVTEKQAERRVLMLTNPGRKAAPYTTDTLYAGLQLVMPNETAPAHRHAAFAMRFIIEGEGGFTAVQGQRIKMNRGDVILTPTWNWHDHGKDGSGPMIWLDGLDLPSFTHFPVHFVEHYEKARYPAEDVDTSTSPIVFPWAEMKARLDANKANWVSVPYLTANGNDVSKTLGGSAERINANTSSPLTKETASSVYHVVEGQGHSLIGGEVFAWKKGDVFSIPSWYTYQHFGSVESDVYLYRFDDRPMLKSLGLYRLEDTLHA